MNSRKQWALKSGIALALAITGVIAQAEPLKANVIHWWTSGGESAAIRQFADAYNQAGGQWVDNAVAGADQARATAINRIVGGDPPTAAQFNTSKQFHDLIDQGLLNNVDAVATKENWAAIFPQSILDSIKVNGHYYAAPVDIHMPAWFFYSKPVFAKAGIAGDPKSFDEFVGDLDKLKKAGVIPLALGGQPWQEKITFDAVFADVGGPDLYLKVYRDRDQNAVKSDAFKKVLASFKKLHDYVDAGSPGRNWNDATALVISGKAGVQIMGDWAKGEFSAAKQAPGKDFGCFPGFGPRSPYLVAGDVFVFPKTDNATAIKAQNLLATVMTSPQAQVAFSAKKGSIPIRPDVDVNQLDICAKEGIAIMKDKSRQLPNPEMLLSPDMQGALTDVITNFWNKNQSVDDAQKAFASALKG
ncbi:MULTISPECIES: ABC transporter substrate-binding protein [Paraburkholderia]|jgi:glucose/mannose transport system substrate-binding protein|uniref:Carbohydrate ABC transporter substrate-binding protein, CUT1 family n=4 Tax=Paraburkholderia TaxID=1822464 RepID=A0A7Z7BD89_9BURK|nr:MULTISPECIES: ABC transporter substrate-binding protein [Paraburkholderia]SKC91105.1 carbohydrate ABC transporter substrate-binding protein, CUT1 family [Burkholderia sp. CF099]SOE90788.1 carbohydrate ABC transporter substrate-binding protein, CUT1 family [Burkholderia sp. YR290]AUT62449.1 carbohydrate ABC transporter substrate-binding protein [Paraburkholderia terrae]AUT71633.1 carbohydrate ABC transporter substrate-binding protein [Paraburkholderia hospita]AXF02589.1 carbohydrate ABC tran